MDTAIAVVSIPQLSELITAIKDIVRVVHASRTGPSSRTEFISYLQQVIALLERDQRYIHVDVVRPIQNLQLRLRRIVEQLAPQKKSLVGRVRAMLVSNEYLIEEARKEIDDTLRLIQLNALSNGEEPNARPSVGGRMCESVTASAVSTVSHQERGRPTTAFTGKVCACGLQDRTPFCAQTGANSIDEDQGPEALLIAAYKDCLHHRRLAANNPTHLICLASSLDRLAKLLRKSGEAAEATKHSREAVEIYRRVANGGLDQVNEPRRSRNLVTHS